MIARVAPGDSQEKCQRPPECLREQKEKEEEEEYQYQGYL